MAEIDGGDPNCLHPLGDLPFSQLCKGFPACCDGALPLQYATHFSSKMGLAVEGELNGMELAPNLVSGFG